MTDGQPWHVVMNDPENTTVRSAWLEFGTGSAKNMDNEGGRPFLFPGKVPGYENMFPDVDRVNPEYFQLLDRKIDYLNDQGFVPFIEVSRRDASLLLEEILQLAGFLRALHPVRLVALSGQQHRAQPDPPRYHQRVRRSRTIITQAIDMVMEKYGPPPFGTLLSANANPSTLENWGDDSWVTLHQTGNMREHNNYWYLTEIFQPPHPQPALNGEPYYSGYTDARGRWERPGYQFGAPGGTEKDDQFVRSAMYGSFLSGGFAGHVYGAEGIWGADIEPAAPIKMWDAFQWNSAAPDAAPAHVRLVDRQALPGTGAGCRPGLAQQEPRPASVRRLGLLRPHARPEIFLVYFEKGCPRSQVRGARLSSEYRAEWFDPRNGTWQPCGNGITAVERDRNHHAASVPVRYRLGTAADVHGADTDRRAKDSG